MAKTSTGLDENVAGLLCYVLGWVSGIVFILIEPKNNFVRFHAMQSIITFVAITVASSILTFVTFVAITVASSILGWIPFIGPFLAGLLSLLGFILWIVLMVKAYQGTMFKLPWAGNLAEKWVS